jgi:hypothetical protein
MCGTRHVSWRLLAINVLRIWYRSSGGSGVMASIEVGYSGIDAGACEKMCAAVQCAEKVVSCDPWCNVVAQARYCR